MKTFLVEQNGSAVVDLILAKDALAALNKVVASPRYQGALAADVSIRTARVTHSNGGRA